MATKTKWIESFKHHSENCEELQLIFDKNILLNSYRKETLKAPNIKSN